ncbi:MULTISPECIES: response regulator transcription factor [Bacillales]|uniref:response regulator transcription factor n=1 Tax=Bacillales TaxID=1385 RepID=UPI0006A75EB3|nr:MULTISPECIES: response regulator transcription factor [Bacillales]OBZ17749.1 hypothetical protein A7975_07895 [Bacillus sp. FJAT-26390]
MWKVLIIDDDFQVIEGMERAIAWSSLDAVCVGTAIDGKEGLKKIRELQPDIIITDIYMPIMNGLEMIEQLRDEDFCCEIIILSGYSDFQYARQALRLQVSDYLSKPLTVDELNDVLEKVVRSLEVKELNVLEKEEIKYRLMRYEPFVQKEWLKAVVTGTFEKSLMNEKLNIIEQKRWLQNKHVVMAIELVHTNRISNLALADWNLFRFALENIICEILKDDWPESKFVELHSHHVAVVLHISPDLSIDTSLSRIRAVGERIIQCIFTYLNILIRVGIGDVKSLIELSDSTEQAFLDVLQQSTKQYHTKQRVHSELSVVTFRPIKFYQDLSEAVLYAKEDTINQVIDEYLLQFSQLSEIDSEYLQYLCTELWTILSFTLYKANTWSDEVFSELNISHEIKSIHSIDDFRHWLIAKIQIIFTNRGWYENRKHKEVVDFMIDFVHQRHAEEVTLETLSKQLYLSRNYLNQIFKKATGETFTNYLIRVRMEKAKALLLDGKFKIYEISEMVGYRNVPYFSSLFKKNHGVNPSEIGKSKL